MNPIRLRSGAEQVAQHLREAILRGSLTGTLPGIHKVATELGVNHKTVGAAVRQLEKEGLLVARGVGRRRDIALPSSVRKPGMKVAMLLLESSDSGAELEVEIRHQMEKAGHTAFFTEKTLIDLAMDKKRVATMVKRIEADAWLIGAGSADILRWFSQQPTPAFALFGRRRGLPIAGVGPDKRPIYATTARRLIKLGHRRITLLCRQQRRLPSPGQSECAFLKELESSGIRVSDFNLPEWEESKEGFTKLLELLFRVTPPTALLLDEPFLYSATLHFLAKKGLRVPDDISLVCTDSDPSFAWCDPSVAHIRWDHRPVVRRVMRWISNVSQGKEDLHQTLTTAEFVDGGTTGPAVDC